MNTLTKLITYPVALIVLFVGIGFYLLYSAALAVAGFLDWVREDA